MSINMQTVTKQLADDLGKLQEKLWLMETQETSKIVAQWPDITVACRELFVYADNVEEEMENVRESL